MYYNRKGDNGTSRIGKKVFSKTSFFIETLGQLDELVSIIGVTKLKTKGKIKIILHEIQEDLFIIQARVASKMLNSLKSAPDFGIDKTIKCENYIDKISKELKTIRSFIIPGSTPLSAEIDYLRAKTRTVERAFLRTNFDDQNVKKYLNRLSSLLFVIARLYGQKKGNKEFGPSYK
jgi:ATP:cob(I)alamin adenosyltransferase